METLSAAELASMQSEFTSSLPNLCTIKRPSLVDDGSGGQTETLVTASSNVPCRLDPMDSIPQESVIAERLQGHAAWSILLPFNTDIRNADRVLITGGDTYEVAGFHERAAWTLGIKVIGRKLGQDE